MTDKERLECAERYALQQERWCRRFVNGINAVRNAAFDAKKLPTDEWYNAIAGAFRLLGAIVVEYEREMESCGVGEPEDGHRRGVQPARRP